MQAINTTAGHSASFLEITIADFLSNHDVSVRLRNCIANSKYLPFQTIGEYLSGGDSAISAMMKLRNLGKKTAQELDDLIHLQAPLGHFAPVKADTSHIKSFRSLSDFANPCSRIDELTWSAWRKTLDRQQTSSRSIWEIASELNLKWPFKRRQETVANYLHYEQFQLILRKQGFGRKKLNTLCLCLAFAAESVAAPDGGFSQEHSDEPVLRDENISLRDLIQRLLKNLKSRECEVLRRRFGLDGKRPQTLESIARTFRITRERIRQIERDALEKLRIPSRLDVLRNALERESDVIWLGLAGEQGVVLKRTLNKMERRGLSGEMHFALECCSQTTQMWLSEHAHEVGAGWYREDFSVIEVRRACSMARAKLKELCPPRPIRGMAEALGFTQKLFEIGCMLDDHLHIYRGYLSEKMGARSCRQIDLHKVLSESNWGRAIPLREVVICYNELYPKQPCSVRDALVVMSDAPHLFLSMGDQGWCWLGRQDLAVDTGGMSSAFKFDANQERSTKAVSRALHNAGPVESFIEKFMRRRGASKLVEIVDYCERSSERKFRMSSVGPILLTSPRIVRLAPGIYCLLDWAKQLPENATSTLLLEDRACRRYVMARYAEEPFGSYPLWTPAMESKWSEWAKANADSDLYESLLAVSQPESWPVSASIKERWLRIKESHGCYRLLAEPRFPLYEKIPSLRDLLVVALYSQSKGYMNWILANRLMGNRIDSNAAATVLGMLVGLDVLQPNQHWQKKHILGSQFEFWTNKLSSELYRTGKLSWSSDGQGEMLNQLRAPRQAGGLGWVKASDLASIVERLKLNRATGKGLRTKTDSEAETLSTLEQLLSAQRKRVRETEVKKLMNSLLADAT